MDRSSWIGDCERCISCKDCIRYNECDLPTHEDDEENEEN